MRSRFLLLPAVLLAVSTAGAKTPKTRVDVLVRSMQGTPVEHAEVTVKTVNGKKSHIYWKLYTHEEGVVRTPADIEIPQGDIVVDVVAPQFAPFSQSFEVHDPYKTLEVKLISGMTKLNVHVTTPGGKPVEHADVVVKFVSGRSVVQLGRKITTSWEMRTNQEGVAKVPEIPQGTVLIQVIAKGYQTFGQTFEVNDVEKTIEVKLNSPQEQYSAH